MYYSGEIMKKITTDAVSVLRTALNILSVTTLVTLLTACGGSMSDLHNYINKVKARPPVPIEPIPVIKPYVRFIYPNHDKDPFDTQTLAAKEKQDIPESVSIDEDRVPEFLESFPLDSLRMVGTVNLENELWALIRIPDGAVHRVKEGNYLGTNYGKINEVREVSISLTEVVDNGFGGYKERTNEIKISNPNKPL